MVDADLYSYWQQQRSGSLHTSGGKASGSRKESAFFLENTSCISIYITLTHSNVLAHCAQDGRCCILWCNGTLGQTTNLKCKKQLTSQQQLSFMRINCNKEFFCQT